MQTENLTPIRILVPKRPGYRTPLVLMSVIVISIAVIAILLTVICLLPSGSALPPRDLTDIQTEPEIFSPDDDGTFDTTEIFVYAGNDQDLMVNLYDNSGAKVVDGLVVDRVEDAVYWVRWNGSDGNAGIIPDGVYEIRAATPAQGEENTTITTNVRVQTSPLKIALFTEKGSEIPMDDPIVKGNVTVELTTEMDPGLPDFVEATMDIRMGDRWVNIGKDTTPKDGWTFPWDVSDLEDGSIILRGTLHGRSGSKYGNLTTVTIQKPKSPGDIKDSNNSDSGDDNAILTEDDIPLALAGAAGTAAVFTGAGYGIGLKRCLKLTARPGVRRKKKDKKHGKKEMAAERNQGTKVTAPINDPIPLEAQSIPRDGPPASTRVEQPTIVARYGLPCLRTSINAANHLDGKGNDIILGSVSDRPALHAEYAMACEESVRASRELRGLGIERISDIHATEPTLHIKYGISCNQTLRQFTPNELGIDPTELGKGIDPAINLKYGMPCQTATANLNYLDGKGNDIGGGQGMSPMDGKQNNMVPQQIMNQVPVGPGNMVPHSEEIKVMFNPEKVEVKKSVPWHTDGKSGYDGKGDYEVMASTVPPSEQPQAYYEPKDLEFGKRDPWNEHRPYDDSHPETEFTQGEPRKRLSVRFVCEKCGNIVPGSTSFCGNCGGRAIAVNQGIGDMTGGAMDPEGAYAPNRRPHDHIGTSDDDTDDGDNNNDDDNNDQNGGGGGNSGTDDTIQKE